MKFKFKCIVLIYVLVLLLVSGCEDIKLFWHPQEPESTNPESTNIGPNPFTGRWIEKNLSGYPTEYLDLVIFTENSFTVKLALSSLDTITGTYTRTESSAALRTSSSSHIAYRDGTGTAEILEDELVFSFNSEYFSYSKEFIRQ